MLAHRLGPFRPELGGERVDGGESVLTVLSVTDLAQHSPGRRLHGLEKGVEAVAALWTQHRASVVSGHTVRKRRPDPRAPSPTATIGAHAPALEVSQQVGPAIGRLPMAVLDGHQLLGAIGAHTHEDQRTQPLFFEADVEVVGGRTEARCRCFNRSSSRPAPPNRTCAWAASFAMSAPRQP